VFIRGKSSVPTVVGASIWLELVFIVGTLSPVAEPGLKSIMANLFLFVYLVLAVHFRFALLVQDLQFYCHLPPFCSSIGLFLPRNSAKNLFMLKTKNIEWSIYQNLQIWYSNMCK
jgi:hypothetical protein